MLTALLVGLAVLVLLGGSDRGRLAQVLPAATAAEAPGRSPGGPPRPRPRRPDVSLGPGSTAGEGRTSQLACLLAAAAVLLLVGGLVGVVLAAGVGVLGPRALGRLEPAAARARRTALARDLPLALDLLAACLAGGAPLQRAVEAVAVAVPGECGARLQRVGAALAVGSPPAEAWAHLSEGEEDSREGVPSVAGPAVRALVRAGDGGAPVAAAVARLAADARAAARGRAEAAARRAGVLAVVPLGLCFLPAFVLLGVVPVVVGLAGPLLAQV